MKLLADENIDAPIVLWLRSISFDVEWGAETNPGDTDMQVYSRAVQSGRVILTGDKEFAGWLSGFRPHPAGVILLRLTRPDAEARLDLLKAHWSSLEHEAEGNLVVVTDQKVRIRQLR